MTTSITRTPQADLSSLARGKTSNSPPPTLQPLLSAADHLSGLDSSRFQPILAAKPSVSLVEGVIIAHWLFFIALIVACCLL